MNVLKEMQQHWHHKYLQSLFTQMWKCLISYYFHEQLPVNKLQDYRYFLSTLIGAKLIIKPFQQAMSSKGLFHSSDCFKCDKSSKPMARPTFIEDVVCKESDLENNTMKVMQLHGQDVLMVKQEGEIFALGTKCTHYGAPLSKAALGKGRIRCQWHGACFDLKSGDIEDFPGLHSLPKYNVTIKDGKVIVRADASLLATNKRQKSVTTKDPKNKNTYIIVGGGAAGNMCVQTLREEGFAGRIIFVSAEKFLPYDRVKLTKSINLQHEAIQLRCQHFFEERSIELHLAESMTSLNIKENTIGVTSGRKLRYDKLFLATGVRASKLDIPGAELQNVFSIRDINDNAALSQAIKNESKVVVVGGSFIALEIASVLHPVVKKLTIITRDTPFKSIFGTAVGLRIKQLFQEKGVEFITHQSVKQFAGRDNTLQCLVLENGTELKADVCILGVGVLSNTDCVKKALPIRNDGSIEVDENMKTLVKNVFAGGDIAYAPVMGTKATIRHWQLAHYHGRIAALNMVDKPTKLNSVPFFWTSLYGKVFRYCGFAPAFTSIEIRGNLDDLKFVAFYMLNEVARAVLTVDKDPVASEFGEILHRGEILPLADIDKWLEGVI